jgi:hypothetical protein
MPQLWSTPVPQSGRVAIIYTYDLVEHDKTVGVFSHVSTGACPMDKVTVGEEVLFRQ